MRVISRVKKQQQNFTCLLYTKSLTIFNEISIDKQRGVFASLTAHRTKAAVNISFSVTYALRMLKSPPFFLSVAATSFDPRTLCCELQAQAVRAPDCLPATRQNRDAATVRPVGAGPHPDVQTLGCELVASLQCLAWGVQYAHSRVAYWRFAVPPCPR